MPSTNSLTAAGREALAEQLRARVEDVEHLREHDVHPLMIAQQLRVKPASLERYFDRHGRPDLAALFRRGWGEHEDDNDMTNERTAA